jgi:hypothetical protein
MIGRRIARLAGVLALAAGAVFATATSAQAATPCASGGGIPPASAVSNTGTVRVGVIHLADNNCTYPHYDVLLYPGEDTYHDVGWNEVAAVHIPPGCGLRIWTDGLRRPDWIPGLTHRYFGTQDMGDARNVSVQLYSGTISGYPCRPD